MKHLKTRGMSLFIVMIILGLMSMLGGLLLTSSTLELRMVDAAAARMQAEQALVGASDEIMQQANLAETLVTMGATQDVASARFAQVVGQLTFRSETVCRRSYNATSTNVIAGCRFVEMDLDYQYGRDNAGSVGLGAGIEQPVLKSN